MTQKTSYLALITAVCAGWLVKCLIHHLYCAQPLQCHVIGYLMFHFTSMKMLCLFQGKCRMLRKCMVGGMFSSCFKDLAGCLLRQPRPIDESHASLSVTLYYGLDQFH